MSKTETKVADVVALFGDCNSEKVSVNTIVRETLKQVLGLKKGDADLIVKTVNATRVAVSKARKDAKKAAQEAEIVAMRAELAKLRKKSA